MAESRAIRVDRDTQIVWFRVSGPCRSLPASDRTLDRWPLIDIDVDSGGELEAELRDAALFAPCDVRDVGALRAAIARSADELGPIRILVNNAANDRRYPVEEVDIALWDDLTAAKVRHHFFAAQAVAPMMREAGGSSIINLGSISAHIDLLELSAHITAKAGIEGLTHTLAREFGPWNIRVNCIILAGS